MRSGIDSESLDEVLKAGVSVKHALSMGAQQYETPMWLALPCHELLPYTTPYYAFDPQCASGNLLNSSSASYKVGCDIDNRFDSAMSNIQRVQGNCVKLGELLDEIYPKLKLPCIAANPPFGIRWKQKDGGTIDSTAWTWRFIEQRLVANGCGFMIANHKTIEELGIHEHRWVYLYQVLPKGVWENVGVEVGIVHFCNMANPPARVVRRWDDMPSAFNLREMKPSFGYIYPPYVGNLSQEFDICGKIMAEESGRHSKWNIYLSGAGMLRAYVSTRHRLKLNYDEVAQLMKVHDCHPLTLTTEKESRKLLTSLIEGGIYTIQPEALAAINDALAAVKSLACPLRPVTDFEVVAYADEEETLVATKSNSGNIVITQGKKYELRTGTYKFTQKFTRKKLHYNEESGETTLNEHECEQSGADRYIEIHDDANRIHRFMDRPKPPQEPANPLAPRPQFHHYNEWPEEMLWEFFAKPVVLTIKEVQSEVYNRNLSTMALCEMMAGYKYFPGQRDYYARMGCKDYGLIAASTGTGKTLGALTMVALKSPKRTLICAPQGTMRSSEDEEEQEYEASQWVKEINRFSPTDPVFQLFSLEDYYAIRHANAGEMPPGIYITYPQAMFQNNAFEVIPTAWDDEKEHEQKFCKRMGLPYDEKAPPGWAERICSGMGEINQQGIRCIANPSLATIIATEVGEWDMVIIDEAHLCCNLHAQITQNLLRLQPKYRYAMTATPIPNIVSNLFSLMGWLCVKDWYKGGQRNAAWPYAVNEIGRFNGTFLSFEEDITARQIALANGKRKARGFRVSPVISSPARLLKLLKPTMAYISKEDCNPDVQGCKVVDVRVQMGTQQKRLYTYWLDRGNYFPEYTSPLTIARVQQTRLRGISAAPAGVEYNKDMCRSNFNPKTAAILQLIMQCLQKGEQVVVVAARVEQSSEIGRRMKDSGIPVARIDSTVTAELHTAEANRFKRGDARVMLMGIKCAQAHSFDQCPNLIIGSLEWSYGTLNQAQGRVWRLTSPKPVTVWCVLHKGTIEELLFDRVALKQDAATICLMGRRVPRDFKTMDAAEVLAEHIFEYDEKAVTTIDEYEVEKSWPELRKKLSMARNMFKVDKAK